MGVHIPIRGRVVGNSSLLYKPVRNIPIAGQTYAQKVLGYDPIAYWPLWETSGTTAQCLVNSAQNGTYNSDVSGWPVGTGIGDGNTAPFWDGTNDIVNIYSATLAAVFSASQGTFHAWMKVNGAANWTDGSVRNVVVFWRDWDNYVRICKSNVNNTLVWHYEGNNNPTTVTQAGYSFTTWKPVAITWNVASNQTIAYLDGAPVGAPAAGLANFVGGLLNNATTIGCRTLTPFEDWHGWLQHVAYWSTTLSAATIADLAAV